MKNKKLLMIPGPSPVARPILDALARETVAFGDPAFVQDFKNVLAELKQLWRTEGEIFVVAGSGTLAMEMAVANTLTRGDKVLVVSHGYFGDRYAELCRAKGYAVDVLASDWGKVVRPSEIKTKLQQHAYKAVTVTHVDTSTGVCAPVEEIAGMVRAFEDTLYIVDGVCATAAEPESVDDMGVDILFTGSQKAFGVPPGLAMLWAGKRALARRKSLGVIPDYYVDWERWIPIMHDPSKYFATPAVNMVWALQEAVNIIKAEGLDARTARHKRGAEAIRAAMEALGFTILAEQDCRASTLSCVLYPDGIQDAEFRSILAEEGIQVAGGLAAYAGKMFRLGHMGNIDTHDMVSVVATVERALVRVGRRDVLGKGVRVLLERLQAAPAPGSVKK